MAWKFYNENATPFARDFGLMPRAIAGTRLEGVGLTVFQQRLSLIHDTVLLIQARGEKGGGSDG
jgi:hypothetical protein